MSVSRLFNKVVVTGGAGFIGSNLVDVLLDSGYEIVVLDNFSTGKKENLPESHAKLSIVSGDVCDRALMQNVLKGADAVVHLAAVASVQQSVEDPEGTHNANFIGTLNVLEAAKANNVKRIVFASSAAIYGDTEILPITEATHANPLTPYASDKFSSENYLNFYGRETGIETITFRFFNIFGPRQDPSSPYSGVISIFSDRAETKSKILVYGDGEQTRDFVFVADLAAILRSALEITALPSGAVNVGSGATVSLNELLALIGDLTGNSLEVEYTPPRAGDIRHSLANIERLNKYFPNRNRTEFKAGLKILLESKKA